MIVSRVVPILLFLFASIDAKSLTEFGRTYDKTNRSRRNDRDAYVPKGGLTQFHDNLLSREREDDIFDIIEEAVDRSLLTEMSMSLSLFNGPRTESPKEHKTPMPTILSPSYPPYTKTTRSPAPLMNTMYPTDDDNMASTNSPDSTPDMSSSPNSAPPTSSSAPFNSSPVEVSSSSPTTSDYAQSQSPSATAYPMSSPTDVPSPQTLPSMYPTPLHIQSQSPIPGHPTMPTIENQSLPPGSFEMFVPTVSPSLPVSFPSNNNNNNNDDDDSMTTPPNSSNDNTSTIRPIEFESNSPSSLPTETAELLQTANPTLSPINSGEINTFRPVPTQQQYFPTVPPILTLPPATAPSPSETTVTTTTTAPSGESPGNSSSPSVSNPGGDDSNPFIPSIDGNVFECFDNIVVLGDDITNDTKKVVMTVGYIAESSSPTSGGYLDAMEFALLVTAIEAALDCEENDRRKSRQLKELISSTSLSPSSQHRTMEESTDTTVVDTCIPTNVRSVSCWLMETDLIFFMTSDIVSVEEATYRGYRAIQESMQQGMYLGRVPTILNLEYLSPLPLVAPLNIQKEDTDKKEKLANEQEGTGPKTIPIGERSSSFATNSSVSPWTVGACIATITGGIVSIAVWTRNRHSRRRHVQLLDDTIPLNGVEV